MPHLILLAEDDTPSADLMRLVCERQGYHVMTALNGQEALELLAQHPIDLVLMDVKMPKMDGIEATKRIRSNPQCARLPVIFVTAMVDPEATAEMEELDPTAILTKPFEMKALLESIEQALSTKPLSHHLDNLLSLSLIQEPGRVTGQEQELLTGVAVGASDVGNQLGARQGRKRRAGVKALLKAHQAGLRYPDKFGSRPLAQLLGFTQPKNQIPEPFR